jgi:hypothetical protein
MTIEADFIELIRAIDPPLFRIVEGTAAFALLDGQRPDALPAAYVVTEREVSDDSDRDIGEVLQISHSDIAVIIVTDNVSDITGAAASAEIHTSLKPAVRGALIGHVPASAQGGDPIYHLEANLLRAKNGVVWWRELFGATGYIEEQT